MPDLDDALRSLLAPKRLKRDLPIPYVLGLVQVPMEEAGSRIKALCPFHPDGQPSLEVQETTEGWRWRCWACGKGGDVLDLIREYRPDYSFAKLVQVGLDLEARMKSEGWRAPVLAEGVVLDLASSRALVSAARQGWGPASDFVERKTGVSGRMAESLVSYFNLGTVGQDLIVPVYARSQELVGVKHRRLDGSDHLFSYPGSSLGQYLYGEHRIGSPNFPLVICEGESDTWRAKADLWGMPYDVVGLSCGAGQDPAPFTWIRDREVNIVFDGDEAGVAWGLEMEGCTLGLGQRGLREAGPPEERCLLLRAPLHPLTGSIETRRVERVRMPNEWMDGAIRRQTRSGGDMVGGPAKVTHHITYDQLNGDGSRRVTASRITDYLNEKGYQPHFVIDPFTGETFQLLPASRGAAALARPSGAPATNNSGSVNIQIEWLFTPGTVYNGRRYDSLLDTPMLGLNQLLAFSDSWGVPRVAPAPNGGRTLSVWQSIAGHYGHFNVPSNDHSDPVCSIQGILDKGGAVRPPKESDDDMVYLFEYKAEKANSGIYIGQLGLWKSYVNHPATLQWYERAAAANMGVKWLWVDNTSVVQPDIFYDMTDVQHIDRGATFAINYLPQIGTGISNLAGWLDSARNQILAKVSEVLAKLAESKPN